MTRARDFADLAGGITTADISDLPTPQGKNMVINGSMNVSQRGISFANVANLAYTIDRMQWYDTGAGAVTISQNSGVPIGTLRKSLKVDVTTADASLANSDLYSLLTRLEGYTIAHLGWGTAQAKTVTLSFYIKSPKTGTHSVALRNSDQSRTRVEEFTVSVANVWERKTITIPGDTGGTWQDDENVGLQLIWPLASGSNFHAASTVGSWGTDSNNSGNIYASPNQVNCMDDTANQWFITGIQLETGSTATDIEPEEYAETLSKCLRYYNRLGSMRHRFYSSAVQSANPDLAVSITFPAMRDAPTANPYTNSNYSSSGSSTTTNTTLSLLTITTSSLNAQLQRTGSGAATVQAVYYLELVAEF